MDCRRRYKRRTERQRDRGAELQTLVGQMRRHQRETSEGLWDHLKGWKHENEERDVGEDWTTDGVSRPQVAAVHRV